MRYLLNNPVKDSRELVPFFVELELIKHERGFYTFRYPDGKTKRIGRRQYRMWIDNRELTIIEK
jgi:hypothetical protein